MADVAMCQEKDCPKKDSCYRFRAVPDHYQWYMKPESFDENGCPEHLIILPGHKLTNIASLI